jgi:hypothetical protein
VQLQLFMQLLAGGVLCVGLCEALLSGSHCNCGPTESACCCWLLALGTSWGVCIQKRLCTSGLAAPGVCLYVCAMCVHVPLCVCPMCACAQEVMRMCVCAVKGIKHGQCCSCSNSICACCAGMACAGRVCDREELLAAQLLLFWLCGIHHGNHLAVFLAHAS